MPSKFFANARPRARCRMEGTSSGAGVGIWVPLECQKGHRRHFLHRAHAKTLITPGCAAFG